MDESMSLFNSVAGDFDLLPNGVDPLKQPLSLHVSAESVSEV
jgi:hypothetical protein